MGWGRPLRMRMPRPQPWGLCVLPLLLLLPPQTPRADGNRSLLYHLTCVSSPAPGTPAFWVSGWLGPQQYLSYNNLRGQAEPYGAWVWESPVSWYWEKETTDLRQKQKLFLEALSVLKKGGPYTLQGLLGCELGPDNVSVPVARFALNGEDFMTFDPKTGIWDGDWPESATIGQKWKQQKEVVNKEKTFLLYSCPQRLLGHLERGRGNLEWKGEQPPEGPLVSCTSLSHGPMVGPGFFPQPRLSGLDFQSASRSSSPMGPRRSLHPQSRPCPSLAHSPPVAPRAPRTQLKPPSMAWPPPPPQPHFSPPASLS